MDQAQAEVLTRIDAATDKIAAEVKALAAGDKASASPDPVLQDKLLKIAARLEGIAQNPADPVPAGT